MEFRSPLTIYVVWHPNYKEGLEYANLIYKTFCRDTDNPLSRNMGIPVFFRYERVSERGLPLNIPFEESDKNAIVLLIDDEMYLDNEWNTYLNIILDNTNEYTRVYPIALSIYATDISVARLLKKQFLTLPNFEDTNSGILNKRWEIIRLRLLHDFSRLMKQVDSIVDSQENFNQNVPSAVKLFISHAKHDGLRIATDFRSYVESNTKLSTFFDANDIADGYDFEEQIIGNFDRDTALVVFNSDEYSNREWCRIEVLAAKRHKCPIVVVNLLSKGEKRSFPYIGNVPTLRWNDNFDSVIELTLLQVLNNLFSKEYIRKQIQMYKLDDKYTCIELTSPPELFNYIDIEKVKRTMQNKNKILVVYTDPPLGTEELILLNEIDNDIIFTTPSNLFNFYE